MRELVSNIKTWLDNIDSFAVPAWEDLPEMDLYMDQVISFLEKKLEPITVGDDKLISPFMINNYVKGEVIPAPDHKKYSRTHIGYLFCICVLKQVVSLSDIALLLEVDHKTNDNVKNLFDYFKDIYDSTIKMIKDNVQPLVDEIANTVTSEDILASSSLKPSATEDDVTRIQLSYIALKLAIQAEVCKTFSEKILYEVNEQFKKEKIEVIKEEFTQDHSPERALEKASKIIEKTEKRVKKAEKKNLKEKYDPNPFTNK